MQGMKKFLWAVAIGGLVGAVTFAWISPHLIIWYFTPPADVPLSCKPSVEWAIGSYRKVMLTGVVLGAIGGALLFFVFAGRRVRSGAQNVPPSAHS